MKSLIDEEKFMKRRNHYPQDSTGERAHVGDRVELLLDYNFPKGSIGTIITLSSEESYDFGVEFDVETTRGHSLNDFLPRGSTRGYWVNSPQVRLIAPEKDEETTIRNLLDEAKAEPKIAFIDGKFYALELKPKAMADEITNKLMSSVAIRVSKIRQEAQQKVDLAERKLRDTFVMPEVTLEDIRKGMSVCKQEGKYLAYFVPLHYAPKFLGEREQVTRQICEEHRKVLEHDILLKVVIKQEGAIAQVGTLESNSETFYHYHGNKENCLGTAITEHIEKPADVFTFRERLQKTLEIVNLSSLYDDKPHGLPTAKELEEKSTKLPTDDFIEPPIIIPLGVVVKVLKGHDGSTLVGLIGKVVCERITDGVVGVEFLERIHHGHDCNGTGKPGHCWNFPVAKLEVMPPGARRNRLVVTPKTTTWEDEEFAKDEENTPEDEEFAKFGENNGSMDSICARCGERRGSHYGLGEPSICPDEFVAGRSQDNLAVFVSRNWARPSYVREAVRT